MSDKAEIEQLKRENEDLKLRYQKALKEAKDFLGRYEDKELSRQILKKFSAYWYNTLDPDSDNAKSFFADMNDLKRAINNTI